MADTYSVASFIPPRARKQLTSSLHHGHERTDPYAWLRDADWRAAMQDPQRLREDIRDYLERENAYTAAVMAPVEPLREALFRELKGRIREDDSSVPLPDGPYAYYVRYREGGQQPLFCRRTAAGGDEELLLDGDALAEGREYYRIGDAEHSPDHRYLAYSEDASGAE
ncbi:MAG: S9 family peptidase, partial [Ectothiorhodospiraceae bacterium]|nr:S9 family peptidase [Ectothiorhodospiraceae bacterium]